LNPNDPKAVRLVKYPLPAHRSESNGSSWEPGDEGDGLSTKVLYQVELLDTTEAVSSRRDSNPQQPAYNAK